MKRRNKVMAAIGIESFAKHQAVLILWFAESLTLNPSALFSEFLEYEEIDEKNGNVNTKIIKRKMEVYIKKLFILAWEGIKCKY